MKRQKTRTQREELGLALRALAVLRTHVRYSYSLHPQDAATKAAARAQYELRTAESWIRAALKAANKRDEAAARQGGRLNPGDCAACATLGICSDHRDESRGEQGPSAEDLEIDRLREIVGKAGWILGGALMETYADENTVRLAQLAADEMARLVAESRSLGEKKLALKREVSDLIGKLAVVRIDEREACAELVEEYDGESTIAVAAAIRARGSK